MYGVKTSFRHAEELKQFLLRESALAKGFSAVREKDGVVFPVAVRLKKLPAWAVLVKKVFLPQARQAKQLKELLAGFLSDRELNQVVSSYDLLGSIAVVQIPPALRSKKKLIARALMESNARIKTVLEKTGGREGKYRVQQIAFLAGAKTTVAEHRESGCVMRVDLAKCYFSPRLSTERLRIAKSLRPGQNVLVLFAGVGPFALVAARHSQAKKIICVELNPVAVNYAKENVELNKLQDRVEVMQTDASALPQHLHAWADCILMPLPHSVIDFLPSAFAVLKKKGVIHLYVFAGKENTIRSLMKKIRSSAPKKKISLTSWHKVLDYAPGVEEICLELRVS